MARRSKVIFCLLLAYLYVVVNVSPLRAEALPDVMSGSTTLADNIMTYYALSGSAVANSDWINTLYSSYGSSFGTIEQLAEQGYLVLNDSGFWEPVQELGQMIEQAPAYSSLGLNEMFNVSAEEAAAGGGLAAASGGSILAGSLGGVASTGVVPLLGGVTAAYWGGIALGTLIAHGLGLYDDCVERGTPITFKEQLDLVPSGASSYVWGSNIVYIQGANLNIYYVLNNDNSRYSRAFFFGDSLQNTTQTMTTVYRDGSTSTQNASFNSAGVYYNTGSNFIPYGTRLASTGALNSITNDYNWGINKTKLTPISPDLIGENGNQQAQPDGNGGYTIPDFKPQIDPGTQAGKPLSLQDWQNFANGVSNNNNQTDPADLNKTLFENILDLIRTVIPENVPNPNPNPNPDPWSPPVVTPVPDPSYPDPVPDQQITENPQESENPQQTENPIDTGKPWRLPDLKQKFPFCIPWDIAKIFSKLKVNARQAPHISWRFNPPNTPIDYTFNLDLEDFEEVAALLRTLELMGFIVGLAFVTRYLIGAN